jgi:dihydroorotase-like cyclic amidohydrolase
VKAAGVDLLQLSHLLSTNPAHMAGLRTKGLIAPKMDADIVVSLAAEVLGGCVCVVGGGG